MKKISATLNQYKDQLLGLLFFIILCSTWARISVPIPFSTNGRSEVWFFDMFAIAFAVYLAWSWLFRGKFRKPDRLTALLLIAAAVLFVYYVVLTGYRIVNKNDVSGNFLVTRVILFSLLMYLAIVNGFLPKKSILIGMVGWISLINILQIISFAVLHIPARYSLILTNINVYNALITIIIPVYGYIASKTTDLAKKQKVAVWSVLGANFFVAMNFVILSGSRSAFILYCFVSLVTILVFAGRITARKCIAFAVSIVLLSGWFVGLLLANIPLVSEGIFRSLYFPITAITKLTNNPKMSDASWLYANGSDDIDQYEVSQSVDVSDNVRELIQKAAFAELKEHPLIGTGRPDVIVVERGHQSAHNFLLEYALSYGIPGLFICLALLALPLYFALFVYKIPVKMKIIVLCVYFAVFAFSFFQPLITTKYTISVLLWIAAGLVARHSVTQNTGAVQAGQ